MRVRLCLVFVFATLAAAQVSFHSSAGKIEILIDGKPYSNLYFGPEWPQPFLHPLRTATGLEVTRGYPVEKIEGESTDHIWHHGLWYAHGDINGVDFWRDKGPETTGRIVPAAPPQAKGDTVGGRFLLVTPGKKTIGSIEQAFRFAKDGSNRIVNVKVTILADQGLPLKMGDTEEGALGLRLRDEFREDHGAVLTNSDGLTTSKNIWGKRAKWVDYSTTVTGEKVGVTIFDHPSNPKFPTFWHARNYGLCAANPFGEHDFFKDKTRDGSVTIPAGGNLTFHYRVLIHPGSLDAAEAEKQFTRFAKETH
jgi:hypothetical protein